MMFECNNKNVNSLTLALKCTAVPVYVKNYEDN